MANVLAANAISLYTGSFGVDDAKLLLLLLDMAIVANPMDFFRGDAAVRSWLYSSTIDFDVDLGQAIMIPNSWGRKEVNIKKTRCG